MTRILLLISILLLVCIPREGLAQHSGSKHHYLHKSHRSKIHKSLKAESLNDSTFISYEFSLGNTNPWSGELYNEYPSVQFAATYDNDRNFEIGVFGCFTSSSLNNIDADGGDIFASYSFAKKFSLNVDAYTFLANKSFLENQFGFKSPIYNLYTARLQYDINQKNSFNLGYTILNDPNETEQTLFLEYDYNLSQNVTFTVGYGSDNNITKTNIRNMYAGIGYETGLGNDRFPVKFSANINPLFVAQEDTNFPITLLFSFDF